MDDKDIANVAAAVSSTPFLGGSAPSGCDWLVWRHLPDRLPIGPPALCHWCQRMAALPEEGVRAAGSAQASLEPLISKLKSLELQSCSTASVAPPKQTSSQGVAKQCPAKKQAPSSAKPATQTPPVNVLSRTADQEKQLSALQLRVKEQGDKVRAMKEAKAAAIDIKKEVDELKARRKQLEDLTAELTPKDDFDKVKMANLVKRRFFYTNSFSIYGGVSGQYDYGPYGAEVIEEMLSLWKRHFVQREKMLRMDCTALTPEHVLRASGHVDKFADYMVKDVETGDCYRLDHLIKLHLEKKLGEKKTTQQEKDSIQRTLDMLDGMSKEELGALVTSHGMTAPATGNPLTPPVDFNLMFPVTIGPTGHLKGYLRPETAQGIFVNFKGLLGVNNGRLPFAAAQVGRAYRNEISPRSGLLRTREFLMAEIEHFCFPDDKDHPAFHEVADEQLRLFSAAAQESGAPAALTPVGAAVAQGTIANQTLGYYLARIQQYLLMVGITASRLRFRQHLPNEMAHYACDCWDAEVHTSYGWIECVGCADRSAFDLKCHTEASGTALCVERELKTPRQEEVVAPEVAKGVLGKAFRAEAAAVTAALGALQPRQLEALDAALARHGAAPVPGTEFTVTREMVPSVTRSTRTVHVEEVTPSVVEPSMGVGRVLYSLLEHSFRVRPSDANRTYFALPARVAPVKVCVLPLSSKQELRAVARRVDAALTAAGLSVRTDDSSGSVGRRYARTDEVAVPFCVTVDFASLTDQCVTLRERDSTQQVRLPEAEVVGAVKALVEGDLEWAELTARWPVCAAQE